MYSRRFSAIVITLLLLAELSFSAALPDFSWAESKTHYIAVASDRHNEPEAIAEAMSGMPASVEYVCLAGDMTNFDRGERPETVTTTDDTTAGETDGSAADTTAGETDGSTAPDTTVAETGDGSTVADASGDLTERPHRPGGKQLAYKTSDVLNEVKGVFPALSAKSVSIIYASHDSNATDDAKIMKCADTNMLPSSDATDKAEISEGRSGLIYTGEGNSYYIYGVSYRDMKDAEAGKAAAEKFESWVSDKNHEIPVIVIGHVPIHKARKDNKGATYWNKALNYAAAGAENPGSGSKILRDVVYLHGHNHSRESTEYYLTPGDRIHAEGDDGESDLYYTYVTAGYLTSARTATLLAITDDDISFTKYTGTQGSDEPSVPAPLGERRRVHYYSVTFNEGADAQTVLEGSTAAQPKDPVREGYTFGGWYRDAAYSNGFDFSNPVTEDLTLYAKWTLKEAEGQESAVPEDTSGSDGDDGSSEKAKCNESTARARTGDDSNIVLWCTLMLTALAALIVMIVEKIRVRTRK